MVLSLERVSKRYDRPDGTRLALDDVSLQLDRGQIMGIFGPTRAGKSTLLRIAAGLEAPDSGCVYYKDQRMDQMSPAQLRRFRRRDVGCIWANQPWTPGLAALEHVELPLLIDGCDRRVAERLAHGSLRACDAAQCARADPQELSDGELRRVAIAQALVTEPRLLIADGVVSNLSIIEQEQIMILLAALASDVKVAVLVADTGATSMIRADPIRYLRDGKLLQDDPPAGVGNVYRLPTALESRPAADA